ncbi:MAG TPA: DUF4390 domain-containing protein [Mariprofundaceae bacterium]|nr:DUF4390 domain-containing protein [Mariprofundaceae bacterium]
MRVDLSSPIVYCDAEWPGDQSQLVETLQAGIAVTLAWDLDVEEVRRFWVNKEVATVQVARTVTPDLLSHSWLLEDQATGITRRTYSVQEALRFLVELDHFPLLDQSLLQGQTTYRIVVTIAKHEGELSKGWWARLLEPSGFSMSLDFRLP